MKMMKRETEQRQAIEMLCTDMLVPKDHLLRKIDAAVDFTHIYELVEDLYCESSGRPSCDPVVLFKLALIQHLFGIRSLRQTMRDAEVNVAYDRLIEHYPEAQVVTADAGYRTPWICKQIFDSGRIPSLP